MQMHISVISAVKVLHLQGFVLVVNFVATTFLLRLTEFDHCPNVCLSCWCSFITLLAADVDP